MSDDEAVIAACRPVDWKDLGLPEGVEIPEETPVYPGSVQGHCQTCGIKIWVGPKQQEAVVNWDKKVVVLCFKCGFQAVPDMATTNLINLGNEFRRQA